MMKRIPEDGALLMIDVINDFEFPAAEALLEHALPAAERLAELKRAFLSAGRPVIYVNDNFGRWQCTFEQQIERCLSADCRGHRITSLLRPGADDYFVLKPRHSGFYCTSLDVLLNHLETRTLVLTGFAGDICVIYTANDAYMRGYQIVVVPDCIASETEEGNDAAIGHMTYRLKAEAVRSAEFT